MASERNIRPNQDLRLMDQVRQVLRYHLYRYRTEQTDCKWILLSIRFHGGKTHPKLMAQLLYGAGLRLMECVRLKIQNLDIEMKQIRVVHELMGHAEINTTEAYLHVMDKSFAGVQSPLDQIEAPRNMGTD